MAARQKKIPYRMCVGCREKKDKRNLIRVVRGPGGEIEVDVSGKKPGRGAYICPYKVCLEKAKKNRSLERALRIKMSEQLAEHISTYIERIEPPSKN